MPIPVRRVLCAVGRVVRNFLLLSDSAGEFNWYTWSTGVFCTVFQGMRLLLFHRSVFLTVCTMRSENPFDWGYREELVICSFSYASLNWRNSRQLYCRPPSVMSWEGKNAFHMIHYGKGSGANSLPNDRELPIMVI